MQRRVRPALRFPPTPLAMALVAMGLPTPAGAAPGDPAGGEITVNTLLQNNNSAVAIDGAGNFVVAWQGFSNSSTSGIVARRFDASGAPQSDVQIVDGGGGSVSNPEVARAPGGAYVISYTGADLSFNLDIYLLRFNAAGQPQGATTVNTSTAGGQMNQAVAMDAAGDFVVAWASVGDAPPFPTNVFAQRFDASGARQGSEFQVNTVANGAGHPGVGMDAGGNFVIVYHSDGQDGDQLGIFGRRFDSSGNAIGSEFAVNATTAGGQGGPSVAMNGAGEFAVTWVNFPDKIELQRFTAGGTKAGSETQVSNTAPGSDPRVAIDDDGDVVVTWQSYGHDNPAEPFGGGIFARRYAGGTTAGSEFIVNAHITGNQIVPAIAMNADGASVITWQSDNPHSGNDVVAQRFAGKTTGPDTTPDAFHFTDQNGVTRGAAVTSDPVTIAGIDAAAPVSVTGGQYSVDGGAFTATAGTVVAGDTVSVRHTASANFGTATDTVLTVGGVSDTFTSTTESAPLPDTTPDAFVFTDVTDVEPGDVVESNAITVTGIDAPSVIGVAGGEYRIGAGAYTSVPGTVSAGQTVNVRVTAGAFGEDEESTLTIGGVSDTFTATTRAATHDVVGDANGDPVSVDTSDGVLTNLSQVAQPSFAPAGLTFPNGFFAFDVEGVPAGGTVTVTITLPAGATPDRYVKCTATACAEFAGASIAGNVVTLTLRDGGEGDADGATDGHIQDPGAPAKAESSGGGHHGNGGAFDGWTVGLLALLGLWRRRRPS